MSETTLIPPTDFIASRSTALAKIGHRRHGPGLIIAHIGSNGLCNMQYQPIANLPPEAQPVIADYDPTVEFWLLAMSDADQWLRKLTFIETAVLAAQLNIAVASERDVQKSAMINAMR